MPLGVGVFVFALLDVVFCAAPYVYINDQLSTAVGLQNVPVSPDGSAYTMQDNSSFDVLNTALGTFGAGDYIVSFTWCGRNIYPPYDSGTGSSFFQRSTESGPPYTGPTAFMIAVGFPTGILFRQTSANQNSCPFNLNSLGDSTCRPMQFERRNDVLSIWIDGIRVCNNTSPRVGLPADITALNANMRFGANFYDTTIQNVFGIMKDVSLRHGACAGGNSVKTQFYSPEMVGCGGSVTFANRGQLCAPGYAVCSAMEYAKYFGGKAPMNNYWVDDFLDIDGTTNACQVREQGGGVCGTPLVCATNETTQDLFSNYGCPRRNCGYLTNDNAYFGGCRSSTTAGTLCCACNDSPVPDISVVSGSCQAFDNCVSSPNFPNNYGASQVCNITINSPGMLSVVNFATPNVTDSLTVDGVQYFGSAGPYDVPVTMDSVVRWSSGRGSSAAGWRVCLANPKTKTPLFYITAGDGCTVDGACVYSRNYLSGGNYLNYDNCTFMALKPGLLNSVSFATEATYDILRVPGANNYSGTVGPQNVLLSYGTSITWKADYSNTLSGWKVCLTSGIAPTWVSFGPCEVRGNCISSPNWPYMYENSQSCSIQAQRAGSFNIISANIGAGDFFSFSSTAYGASNVSSLQGRTIVAQTSIGWSSDGSVTGKGWKICLVPLRWSPLTGTSVVYGSIPHTNGVTSNFSSLSSHSGVCSTTCNSNQWSTSACTWTPVGCKNMPQQSYGGVEMVGCGGAVSWANRSSLCGTGYVPCSAATYAAKFGGIPPNSNYWTDDALTWTGVQTACAATTGAGNPCVLPMRVCAANTDAFGNDCTWINCGLETTANKYFGGCSSITPAGTLCCKVHCPNISLASGLVQYSDVANSNPFLSTATIFCPINTFWSLATTVYTCTLNSTWNAPIGSCGCPLITDPHGTASYSDPRLVVGSQVNLTCGANFQIQNGSNTAVCQASGQWTTYDRCGCPAFAPVSNGVLSYSDPVGYAQGSYVNVTCAQFYQGNTSITCGVTGWSGGAVPNCTDINECAVPGVCATNTLCRNLVGAPQQCLPYFLNTSLALVSGGAGTSELFVSLSGAAVKIRFDFGSLTQPFDTQAIALIRTPSIALWQQYSDKISGCLVNATRFSWATDANSYSIFPICPAALNGSTNQVWRVTSVSATGSGTRNVSFQVPPGIGSSYNVIYRQLTNYWTERTVTVLNASYLAQSTASLLSCQTQCNNTATCVAIEWMVSNNTCKLLSASPEYSEVPTTPSALVKHYARAWVILAISPDKVSYNPPVINPRTLSTNSTGPGLALVPYNPGDAQITFTGNNFAPTDPNFGVWLTGLTNGSADPLSSSYPCPLDPLSTSTLIVCTFPQNLFGAFTPLVKALDTFVWGDAAFSIFKGALINYTIPSSDFKCEGGESVTIWGMKFSNYSSVTIDGQECSSPSFINGSNGNGALVCQTPAGTGLNKSIVVRESGVYSTPLRAFNYGAPQITGVHSTDCDYDGDNNLVKCNRAGGALTITGMNLAAFTSAPPGVAIGRLSCTSPYAVDLYTIVCTFPNGYTLFNQITVTQFNGISMPVKWSLSYAQCGPGTKELSVDTTVNTACSSCGPGEYQDLTSQTSCKPCPQGTYGNAAHSSACLTCQPGWYQNGTGQTSCIGCDVGTLSTAPGSAACDRCTTGRYTNATNSSSCMLCTQGKFMGDDGASVCLDCYVGSYGPQAQLSSCLACAPGSYSDTPGTIVCKQCDAGSFQNATNQTNCFFCETGTLSTQKGQPQCTNCPAGSFTNVTNSTSCQLCDPGMHQNKSGSSICDTCEPGKYTAQDSSFVDCSACAQGTYCNTSGCTTCPKCDVGLYQGQTAATDCSPCDTGKFGVHEGAADCSLCKPGSFSNITGQTACLQCEAGSYQLDGGRTFCELCAPGKFTATAGFANCTDCLPGSYASAPGLTNCTLCPIGTAQNNSGRASCDECPNGQVAYVAGYRYCVACGGSSFSLDKTRSCETCPANSFANIDGTSCVCKKGFYSVPFALAENSGVETLQVAAHDNNDSQTGAWGLGFFCRACPDGAACSTEGISLASVEPVPGWCADKEGLNLSFFACPNPSSCLATGCALGYEGSLCKACGDDFGTVSGGVCARCQDRSWERGKLFLIGLVIVGLLALFVYQTRRAALRDSQSFMVAAKILVSGMQFNSIALTMNFTFWVTAKNLLSSQGAVSQLGLQYVFTSECALKSPDYNPVLVSSALYLFSPLLIYVGILPFAAIAAAMARHKHLKYLETLSEIPELKPGDQDYSLKSLFKNYAITGTVIIVFLIHPMLARKAFEMFHCVQIGVNPNETYLYVDLRIQCYTFPHILWVFLLGLPLLLLMVGEPLAFASFLHKHKAQLSQEDYKLNYSFLYKGYQPALWSVWEGSVMARKSLIVAISVFGNRSTRIQALLGVALCFVMLGFHQTYRPFMDPMLNRLELLSILTSASLYFFAQFLLHTTDDVGSSGEMLSQVLIVIFQIVFLVVCLGFIFYGVFAKVKTGIVRRSEMKRGSKATSIQMHDMTSTDETLPETAANPATLEAAPENNSDNRPPSPKAAAAASSSSSFTLPPLYRAYSAAVTPSDQAIPQSQMYTAYSDMGQPQPQQQPLSAHTPPPPFPPATPSAADDYA